MNSKASEFTKKEITAGIFVLVSILVLVFFILIVRGYRPNAGTAIYYTKFKNTLGLDRGADVRFGGLKVGKVVDIYPDPEDPTQVCVKLAISPQVVLNQKCVATVEQVSLTSARHLEISTGETGAPKLEEGSVISSINKTGNLVDIPDFSSTITKVEKLLDDLTDFLGMDLVRKKEETEKTRARITELTQQVSDTLDKGTNFIEELNTLVKEQKPQIAEILKNINEIEKDTKKVVEQVNAVISENRGTIHDSLNSVKDVLAKVKTIADNSADDLEKILENVEKITGNVDNLSSEAKAWMSKNKRNMDELILDIKETIRNLRLLSQTLAEQPQSLITGKPSGGKK